MQHSIRIMSGKGDEVLTTWDTDTVSPDRLEEIETEFKDKMARGYFAADLGTNTLIKEFDPNTDILMIPRMQGG